MAKEVVVEWLGKDLMFLVALVRLLLFPVFFCGIQVKGEYGCRFILDERRDFTDYSTVMNSDRWRLGFRAPGRAKGSTLTAKPDVTVV
ncbi:hypothetical protein Hanom_Chr04g00358861 [Helianthus anomalus]